MNQISLVLASFHWRPWHSERKRMVQNFLHKVPQYSLARQTPFAFRSQEIQLQHWMEPKILGEILESPTWLFFARASTFWEVLEITLSLLQSTGKCSLLKLQRFRKLKPEFLVERKAFKWMLYSIERGKETLTTREKQ